MICHYQLPQICIHGGLDEGASLEELSEHILYYHCDESIKKNNPANTGETPYQKSHANNDAVQFAGLCSALLSLPNTLVGNESSADETREIHLTGSTLVFVPLEQRHGIMAIAQLERLNPVSHNVHGNASPLAVRNYIKKCHDLFCLLRGGIQYHLSRNIGMNEDVSEGKETSTTGLHFDNERSAYPGMAQLYSLRKQVRQLRWDMSRSNDDTQGNERAELMATLVERIQILENTLPIHTLRKQLRTHYDEFIAESGLVLSTTGRLHCCLIENVPAYIAMPSEALTCNHAPATRNSAAVNSLEKAIRILIDKASEHCNTNEPLLVGITSLLNGDFLFGHSSETMPLISPHTACLLMNFMGSYRCKIALHAIQHSSQPSVKVRSPSRRIGSGLRRFLSGSLVDEDTISTLDISINETEEPARFLAPPPLSMLNVSDQVLQVVLPSHGSVWTPQVYLPLEITKENQESVCTDTNTLEINLVLLDVGPYSFLLYLRPGTRAACNENGASQLNSKTEQSSGMTSSAIITIPAYSRLLEMIAINLSNAVTSARDLETDSVESKQENTLAESGQHVVFIDRATQRVVLFSDGDERNSQRKGNKKWNETSAGISSGMDCHILASNLPPNVVAAFDDLMTQVYERTTSSKESVLQLCTYAMPEGWVYAHAQDDKELYIYFKASKFVTISDVQRAADRVRTTLFKDASS